MFVLIQHPGTLPVLSSLSKRMTNYYKIVLASSLSTLGRILSEPVDLNVSDLCTLLKLFFTHSAYACHCVKINFPWSLVTINFFLPFFFFSCEESSETALTTSAFLVHPLCLFLPETNNSTKLS